MSADSAADIAAAVRAGERSAREVVDAHLAAIEAREPELAIHLRMARRQGWTEDELVEALIHCGGYVGVPLVRDALLVATKVFAEMRNEKA